MENTYDFSIIEAKWQADWEKSGLHVCHFPSTKPKFYVMEMFAYPSGAGLHGGHVKNYVPTDAFCRYKAMKGFNVLYPTGWDAFGQPAENEAIKRGVNPKIMVTQYADNFRRTMKRLGLSYDWTKEINTSAPEYYKWTQWFFLLLYKRNLAYRANAAINWCPSCKTGLANEEAKENRCWRCDSIIEKRPMPQWYFKITEYAERLINDLELIQWPEGVKQMQREWIGKSEGARITFHAAVDNSEIPVFTTRPDTLFGATALVLAPEHAAVSKLTTPEHLDEVNAYIERVKSQSDIQRLNTEKTFTGVFTGAFAINPANNEPVPIWIADYVLMGYGTGAIMCVPAHDQRDFEFARRYQIPIRLVYQAPGGPSNSDEMTKALPHEGVAINSGQFDGMPNSKETIKAFCSWVEETGKGKREINYKIRDWLISRQRYWGAPIPIVHCNSCGEVPVPEGELPVLLPDVDNFQPSGTGESPLATISEFVNVPCPKCSQPARRETDTMGGFACSSWYFLRYIDPHNQHEFASRQNIDYWLPVDLYTGGTEHAVMHLLYARFWTKVMKDANLIGFEEPFLTLRNQGTMLGWTPGRRPRADETTDTGDEQVIDWIVLKPDERATFPEDKVIWRWARMSKSKGNGIQPDETIAEHGADAVRLYVMFVTPFEDDVRWSEDGLIGATRFINRVWRWVSKAVSLYDQSWSTKVSSEQLSAKDKKVRRKLHQTIRKVSHDLENFDFNTAIAALMELVNELYASCPIEGNGLDSVSKVLISEILEKFIPLLSPFCPHLADELWSQIGQGSRLYKQAWPDFDPSAASEDELTLVVQINGKVRDKITVPADSDNESLEKIALASESVSDYLKGRQIQRVIVVPRKLVNVVIQ